MSASESPARESMNAACSPPRSSSQCAPRSPYATLPVQVVEPCSLSTSWDALSAPLWRLSWLTCARGPRGLSGALEGSVQVCLDPGQALGPQGLQRPGHPAQPGALDLHVHVRGIGYGAGTFRDPRTAWSLNESPSACQGVAVTWVFWDGRGDLATWVTAGVALLAVVFALVPFVRDSRDRVRAQARGLIVYSQTSDSIGQATGANGVFADPLVVSLINKTGRLVFRPVVVWSGRRWAILRLLRPLKLVKPVQTARMRRAIADDFGPVIVNPNFRSDELVLPGDHMALDVPSAEVAAKQLTDREPWVLFRDASGRRWVLSVDRGRLKRVWPWQGPLGREANKVRPHASLLPPDAMRQLYAKSPEPPGSEDSR